MPIYADYAGSSQLTSEVQEYLHERINNGPFANPNSTHYYGRTIKCGIEKARKICAQNIGAKANQIIFNSGSTEGVTTIFQSLLTTNNPKKTIIISAIEHPCIFNLGKYYEENKNYNLKIIPVNQDGIIDLVHLSNVLSNKHNDIALLSIMAANNETGVIQPITEISKLCNQYQIPFLCDTTQYIGKRPFNFNELQIDYAVLSGHKIGALTGIGFIVAKDPNNISPLFIGGGQEDGLRGGTQNYLGIETLAVAINNNDQKIKKFEDIKKKKLVFEQKIKESFPDIYIIGEKSDRLPGSTYISYPGLHGQAIQIELEANNIFVSTTSACSDNDIVSSRIIKNMHLSDSIGRGVIRISLNHDSNINEYDHIFDSLNNVYNTLSKLNNCL